MVAVKAKFDGEIIEVPAELKGAPPGDVLIFYQGPAARRGSVWDVIGKSPKPMNASEIDAVIREERSAWKDL